MLTLFCPNTRSDDIRCTLTEKWTVFSACTSAFCAAVDSEALQRTAPFPGHCEVSVLKYIKNDDWSKLQCVRFSGNLIMNIISKYLLIDRPYILHFGVLMMDWFGEIHSLETYKSDSSWYCFSVYGVNLVVISRFSTYSSSLSLRSLRESCLLYKMGWNTFPPPHHQDLYNGVMNATLDYGLLA